MKNRPEYQKTKEGDHLTLVCCIGADGVAMVPTLIFKGDTVPEIPTHGFSICSSENGWIDNKIKENWMNHFIKFKPPGPVVLLLDGHTSNFSYEIEQLAKNNGITMIQFPSNSTHLLQPLDSNFFRILKDNLRYAISQYSKENKMTKWDIMELLVDPWHKSTAPGTIKKSFQIPGVYPINKEKWNLYFKGNNKEILSSIFGSKENETTQPSHSSQSVLSISYFRYQ